MSLLSPSRLRVALTPGAVILVRTRGLLKQEVADARILVVESTESGKPWEDALGTLKTGLAAFAARGESLTVLVSNHFSHYTLLPALASLSNSDEDAAFARYTFREVFGEGAAGWTIRVSGDSPNVPRVASAIDEALLQGLRRCANDAGLKLASVQPFLMAAFNAWIGQLPTAPTWLALYEPGRLCICLCVGGELRSVRGCPAGDTWRTELPLLLDREARLQELDGDAIPTGALVFHPSQPVQGLARSLGDGLTPLGIAPHTMPDNIRIQDIAMALVGL